jgi:hypothetical protein
MRLRHQLQQYLGGLGLPPKLFELGRRRQLAQRSALGDLDARAQKLQDGTATKRDMHQRPAIENVFALCQVLVAILLERS